MTITIKGDLILKEDTTFKESIIVEGNIKGYFDLKVTGNIVSRNIDCMNIDCMSINCRNIVCMSIDCWNIVCMNIYCLNIDCMNIDCLNINCMNIDCRNIILCDKIKVKKGCKVKAKALIKDRFNLEQKEFKLSSVSTK